MGVILTIKSNCDHILQVYQQLTFEQHGTEQITQVKKNIFPTFIWLVVSIHLKNISQFGSFLQIGMKIKNL